MPLSWNEIRHRAIAFSKEWKGETREATERQSFWNDFSNVFGVHRRSTTTFESVILSGVEGSLSFPVTRLGLENSGPDRETPRLLIVSDFTRTALRDLEPEQDPGAPLYCKKSNLCLN